MRRTSPILAVLSALAVLLAPSGARAAGSFVFYGAGFGHGVGMSQYGALGMAKDGSGYQEILTHFYSGTEVAKRDLPGTIRVGIVQGIQTFDVQARRGPVELHLGSRTGQLVDTIPKDAWWKIKVGTGRYRIFDDDDKLAGGGAVGGRNQHLYATFPGDSMLGVKQNSGISFNRGALEFNIYEANARGRLVALLSPQEYLYGIGEMPSDWPVAALRAQAVASRTYAFEIVDRSGVQGWCNCHVVDDTRNQVYIAWGKEGGTSGDRWVAAVDDTEGEVVLFNGKLIQAFFMSSSGGYTEDVENIWGSKIPYLKGVCDPGDDTAGNSLRAWTRKMTASQVTSGLRSATGEIGTVKRFENPKRGVSGRVLTIRVVGGSGSSTITGSELRLGLGLYDTRVWVDEDLRVSGPIRDKYDSINCRPKQAISPETEVGVGTRQRFQVGTIYHRQVTGAHWIHGAVLGAYLDAGGPAGDLGFPTTDVKTSDAGVKSATFQHGEISCDGNDCQVS